MKRLNPTDIVTPAHVEAILRDIESFDDTDKQADSIRPEPLPQLSPGFRRVHIEPNGTEREPLDGEPYMIVERIGAGDFETIIMPYSFDGGRTMYVPRHGGPWEITELSDNGEWVIWIRLARKARHD